MPHWIPEVFVLWHPNSPDGEVLAHRIHDWLRPAQRGGPEVFYRCLPAPGGSAGGLPLPLPGDPGTEHGKFAAANSNVQCVIPLIDAHMVADPGWRHWLHQLDACSVLRLRLPVALDNTAYNVPSTLARLNFLRPTRPAGIAAAGADAVDTLARSLLRQITESLGRLMLRPSRPDSLDTQHAIRPALGVNKVRIFLSHAKKDGAEPARRLRNYIYSNTQMEAFFDENDIPYANQFAEVLAQAVDPSASSTVAMVAIRSAAYAERPWCRWELGQFRRPIPIGPAPSTATRWRMHPLVVVDALEGGASTVGIPEFGNAPVVRWSDVVPDLEERILTHLLREAVLGAYHDAVGARLVESVDGASMAPNHLAINWRPDPVSLLRVLEARGGTRDALTVYHPGRMLSGRELDLLFELFPHVELCSFEEALA